MLCISCIVYVLMYNNKRCDGVIRAYHTGSPGSDVLVYCRAAPFYVGWSGSGGGGCSNASNAPYAPSADIKIYNT